MIDRATPLPKLSIPLSGTAIVMSLEVFQHDISLEHAAFMEINNTKTRVRRRIPYWMQTLKSVGGCCDTEGECSTEGQRHLTESGR